MYENRYPHLFEPLQIGNVLIKNRIEASPTGYMYFTGENFATHEGVDYYELKARGGAGLVTVAGGIIDGKSGQDALGKALALDNPDILPSLSMLADAVRKHGAIASMQLHHPGMFVPGSLKRGFPAYGPVEMPIGGVHTDSDVFGSMSTPMTEDDIWRYIELYAEVAYRMKTAGFQMVLIHGGHGWQMSQFMSPFINTRTDKWGGPSLENRMRFPLEVCKAIKEKCGKDFPIEFRMSGDETNPNGYDITEGVEIAKMLDGKVDLIHVSTGSHEVYEAFVVTHPSMFLPDGVNLPYAAEIKKHVATPVTAVGAFNDPAHMNQAIADGSADVVAVARALIADPFMPKKARAGRAEDINQCLRCFTCFSRIMNLRQITCAINPSIGREDENKYQPPDAQPRKVLVIGGGVAGMQAALVAADRGHSVILVEKNARLGGTLLCEKDVGFKRKLDLYLATQARRATEHPAIDLRLNTTADADLIATMAPDAVVVAIGSAALVPSFIPGYDRDNVFAAEDAYRSPEKLGDRVVIVGGGLVGSELGIYLDSLGHRVTIVEMADTIGFGDNVLQGQALDVKIAQTAIDLHLSTKVTQIGADGVAAQGKDGAVIFPADSVVYAVGYKPLREEASTLTHSAPEVYQIGDCVAAATIWNAVKEASYCANAIGVFKS